MNTGSRSFHATRAATKHLLLSAVVALLSGALVFGIWYPYPYREISGGRELFTLLMSVDVVAGPLLTLFVFTPTKPRGELVRDLSVIVLLQVAALVYGLYTVHAARPVINAFEGDRFRVVTAAELEGEPLDQAPAGLKELSHSGPRLIAVRLAKSDDPDYVQSIKASMEGNHPAMRPSRWMAFDEQRKLVAAEAKALSLLRNKQPSQSAALDQAIAASGLAEADLGYLPLVSRTRTDWVVLVDRKSGSPKAYAPIDGW